MGLDHSVTKADGSILAVGTSGYECSLWPRSSGPGVLTVVQLKPDGSVDAGFSNGGVNTFPQLGHVSPLRLFTSDDGKAVIVLSHFIVRLDRDGSLDPTFGDGGLVSVAPYPEGSGRLRDAAIQADGKIVALGYNMSRFDTDGQLDGSFGDGGVADGSGQAVAVDSAGNVVVADMAEDLVNTARRFDSQGDPDLAFGGNGDGIARAPDAAIASGAFRRVMIQKNGTIRLYGSGTCTSLYCSVDFVSVIDPDGLPLPSLSGNLPSGGGNFAEDSQGRFAATWGSSRLSRPQFWISGPEALTEGRLPTSFSPTPGESTAFGVDYSALDDSFIAVGHADYGNCWFCGPTQMVVAKVDASTRLPDPGFGVGGVALIPENTCPYGKGPDLPDRTTPWNRCLLKKPKIDATVKVRYGKKRGPSLSVKATLSGVHQRPYFVGEKVTVKLPKRFRLNRGAGRKLFASDPNWKLNLRGRRLTVRDTSTGSYVAEYEPEPDNTPVEFRFGLRPGALKPIGRKLLRKRPKMLVEGTYFATNGYEPSSSRFFAPNTRKKLLPVRLARQQRTVRK